MFGKNFGYLSVFALFSVLILLPMVSATLDVSLSDQGTDVRNKTSGEFLASGNLSVLIYDSMTGGNLVYGENFTDAIFNGSWNVMLGENSSNPLSLEYGKKYYKDYLINGEDASFQNLTGNTVDRQFFHSPLGDIADEDVNDSTNLTLGERITFALGEMIDNIVNGWLRITGSLNVTGNVRVEDAGQAIFFVNASSGRVGIGTDDPGGKLHVVGDEGTGMLGDPDPTGIILIGGAGNDGMSGKDGADISITGGSGGIGGIDPGGLGGDVIINPGSGGEGSPAGSDGNVVLAATAGKVGIGISTPSAKLHVDGDLNVTGNISAPEFCLNGDCQTSWPAGGPGGGWTNTTNDTYTYKNVGIGTDSPGANLDVNGTVYSWGGDGDINNDGLWTTPDNTVWTNEWTTESPHNFTKEQYVTADMDGDGRVTWDDYGMLQRRMLGDTKEEAVDKIHKLYGARSHDIFYVDGRVGIGTILSDDNTKLAISTGSDSSVIIGGSVSFISSPAGPAKGLAVEGKTGIGTVSPNASLHVNGSVIVEDASGNRLMVLNASDNDTLTINPSDKGFGIVYINSSTYIRGGTTDVDGSGNVQNSDKNEYIKPYLDGTKLLSEEEFARADASGDGKVTWDDYAIWKELIGKTVGEGDFWEKLRNTTRNISSTYGVRDLGSFYVNGKLGVGDYTPDSDLEVVGGLMVSNASGGDGDFLIVKPGTGNVGFGTASPNATLDVNGSVYFWGGSGDVQGSGIITVADQNLVSGYLGGTDNLSSEDSARADVNGDGKVDWSDYYIIGYLNGYDYSEFWSENYITDKMEAMRAVDNSMGGFATGVRITNNLGIGINPVADKGLYLARQINSSLAYGGMFWAILGAAGNGSELTGLLVQPTFKDYGYSDVNHYGLIVTGGKSGFNVQTPNATLDVNGSIYVYGGTGDMNGDGFIVSAGDCGKINDYLLGNKNLTTAEFATGDINGDGNVNWDDYFMCTYLNVLEVNTTTYRIKKMEAVRKINSLYGADVTTLDRFKVNGDLYVVNGRIGVGDSTPEFGLEVVGNMSVSGAAGYDGDRFIVKSDGNVGIGTNNPSERLNVNGSIIVENAGGIELLKINDSSNTSFTVNSIDRRYGTTLFNTSVYFYGGSGDGMGTGTITFSDKDKYNDYWDGTINLTAEQYATLDVTGDGMVNMNDRYMIDVMANEIVGSEGYEAKRIEGIRTINKIYGVTGSDYFYVNGKLGVGKVYPSTELNVKGSVIIEDSDDNIIMLINSTENSSMVIDPANKWLSTLIINSSTYIRGGSGDADGDEYITATDSNSYIKAYIEGTANITEEEFARSDINGDGKVSWDDVAIWSKVNGMWYPESEPYLINRMEAIRNVSATYGVRSLGSFYVNGKLGVGDYTPDSELEVVGGGMFSSVTGGDGDLFIINSSTGYVGVGTNNPSERLNVNGSLMVDNDTGDAILFVNTTSGRVGIGTSSPNTTLTVAGNITPSANDTYSLGGPGLWWKDMYVGSDSLYIGGIPLHEEEGVLKWGGKEISGLPEHAQEKVAGGDFVLSEGIETMDAKEICLNGDCRSFWPEDSGGQGRIEATEICLNGECHTEWPDIGENEPLFDLTGGFIGTTLGRFLMMGQAGYALSLGANGIMDMIFVSEEGNVGIGTGMPSAKLDVNGSINATGTICDGEGNCLDSVSLEITPDIEDGDWTVEGEDMHSGVEGNVGIGTSEPSAKLHVSDTMKIEPRDEAPVCDENGMLYVDASGALCYCDGNEWSVAAGSGTCGQAESPAE